MLALKSILGMIAGMLTVSSGVASASTLVRNRSSGMAADRIVL